MDCDEMELCLQDVQDESNTFLVKRSIEPKTIEKRVYAEGRTTANTEDTELRAVKIHPDHKMYANQQRFGRHLATKSVTERDFASRRRDIDDSEKLTLQKLKLEKIKVWEELRRINVKSRSLKRGSLIEREIVAERRKIETEMQEQHRPVSSAAIHNHLSGSLVITGVQPQARPTFRDEDGRPIRPKITAATYRVALSARQIDELRPKTAGSLVTCGQPLLYRESSELLPAAMSRKLFKADRLADSLDNLHIRHYLYPEELKSVERNNNHNRRTRTFHSGWQPRHLLSGGPTRTSSDDGQKATNEKSIVINHDSIQPKRLLYRERSANKLRRESLSLDDVSHLQDTRETREAADVVSKNKTGCDKLATKGFITKPVPHPTIVKLPSVEPEENNEEVTTDSS